MFPVQLPRHWKRIRRKSEILQFILERLLRLCDAPMSDPAAINNRAPLAQTTATL